VLHPDGATVAGSAPAHRIRLRFLGAPHSEGDSVVVIEDLERLEQRAQQLKLASMGRLSASIAHEIRNPLGAIRHANGLLAERLDDPRLQRLAAIVEDNSVRINRVVEHVLSIARRERAAVDAIDMALFLQTFVPEFAEHNDQPVDRLAVAIETEAPLMFDVEHLRQVLVNLTGNALRYASGTPAAVRISWRAIKAGRLELAVSDDGPGLTPEQAQHAFEPFYTTEARGTGLGLFLVRELCASNGASIRYERHPAGSRYAGGFVIMPMAAGQ
jgi:two-component system sensor histidine kinase PilS (NtrC family)